ATSFTGSDRPAEFVSITGTSPMRIIHFSGAIVAIGLFAASGSLMAQPPEGFQGGFRFNPGGGPYGAPGGGAFGARMMLDRLDANKNGRIDPDELSQSRMPLADMAERAGVDASRGLDEDDLEKIFP